MMMTFAALPLAMSVTKYAILLFVIVFVVPFVIGRLEKDKPLKPLAVGEDAAACAIKPPSADCTESFAAVSGELGAEFGRNVWMLLKPTLTIMLIASVMSATILTLVPWSSLLSQVTPARVFLVSIISVFMPVPIALDVMFAAQLHQKGVAGGYVMLFLMTLGTYSIIPSIYMWREVSKRLSVILFAFFMVVGWIAALLF